MPPIPLGLIIMAAGSICLWQREKLIQKGLYTPDLFGKKIGDRNRELRTPTTLAVGYTLMIVVGAGIFIYGLITNAG